MEGNSLAAVEGETEERGLSKLPRDVKELIFAKLSFTLIYGARSVCKEWNFILSSSSFLSSLPKQDPSLFFCGQENDGNWLCIAYCFKAQKWMTLPLSFLPNFKEGYVTYVSNTSQGLLLFQETYDPRLFVCNIHTKTYVEIELDLSDKFVSIIQGRNEEPYLIACSNSESFSFEIYHYFQDSWRIKCQYEGERGNNMLQREMVEMVECNGILFWMGRWPTIIAGYKIRDEGFITTVRVAPLPYEMIHYLHLHVITMAQFMSLPVFSMVSYGSSILLVGTFQEPSAVLDTFPGTIQIFGGNPPNRTGIVIWELYEEEVGDESVWNWREFVRMPSQLLPQNFHPNWCQLNCICVGDYLCFSRECEDGSTTVFVYNLREGVWQNLSPSDNHHINWTIMGRMMSFEPNFIV